MTVSWDNVILDPIYSYGFSGGPGFGTRIVQTDGGGEERVSILSEPIWAWSAVRENVGELSDVKGLRDFFIARRGALHGFLFFDPIDFSTSTDGTGAISGTDETIGYGDGTTTRFTMRKTYYDPSGMVSRRFARRIIPIVQSATAAMASLIPTANAGDALLPIVQVNGNTQQHGTDYSISPDGKVQFRSAPQLDDVITAGAYFTVPARFTGDTDEMFEMTAESFGGDSVSFGVVSLPYDEEVPVIPGATEYGFVEWDTAIKTLDSKESHWYSFTGSVDTSAILPSAGYYPLGGPHFRILNNTTGSNTVTVKDSLGNAIATLSSTQACMIFVKANPSGVREAVAVTYTKQ